MILAPSGMTIRTLNRTDAERQADALLAVDAIGWTRENLLTDLPDKWQLSFAMWPGPVGYAILSRKPSGVHLHHLAVREELRNQGLGSRMIAECLARGVVTLKVHHANAGAIRLYQKHGFVLASEGEYRWMTVLDPH